MTDTDTAAKRADQIRKVAGNFPDGGGLDAVAWLFAEAYEAGDHKTLGYASWADYVNAEFGAHRRRIERSTRLAWMPVLEMAGMLGTEMAAVFGVSKSSVSNDRSNTPDDDEDAPVQNFNPELYRSACGMEIAPAEVAWLFVAIPDDDDKRSGYRWGMHFGFAAQAIDNVVYSAPPQGRGWVLWSAVKRAEAAAQDIASRSGRTTQAEAGSAKGGTLLVWTFRKESR